MSEKQSNEQNSTNNACCSLLLIADIVLVILLTIITIKGLSSFKDCKIDYKTISLFVFVIVICYYILHKCILCCRDVLNCCNSKPKAPDSKLKCIGICMGITYCFTVVSVIYVLASLDNINFWPVLITFSITAILFSIIFYFIYRYHLNISDDIMEDYLKDKELYRKKLWNEYELSKEDERNKYRQVSLRIERENKRQENHIERYNKSENLKIERESRRNELNDEISSIKSILELEDMPKPDNISLTMDSSKHEVQLKLEKNNGEAKNNNDCCNNALNELKEINEKMKNGDVLCCCHKRCCNSYKCKHCCCDRKNAATINNSSSTICIFPQV